MSDEKRLPILAIKDEDLVVFPGLFFEVNVGRSLSVNAVTQAKKDSSNIVIAFQKNEETDVPTNKDVYTVCVEAEIRSVLPDAEGNLRVILRGLRRGKLKTFPSSDKDIEYLYGKVEFIEEPTFDLTGEDTENLQRLKDVVIRGLQSVKIEDGTIPKTSQETSAFVDNIAGQLPIPGKQRLKLLRLKDPRKRLELTLEFALQFADQNPVNITSETPPHGEDEMPTSEAKKLHKLVTESGMDGEALKVVQQEMRRLRMMAPTSSEFQVTFNYIETMASLPWKVLTDDKVDVALAKKSLNDDHYGLEKAKDRILEFLAVRKLAPDKKGSILCFAGSPGVGKTSLGKSIAKAMGRKFIRMSLGGVNDEAEIRGHRRTYVGAMPGQIIQQIRRIECRNPVFMLDELDKVCRNFRGDPSAALLEVLDPEQNASFMDNYLGVPFDLSQVMFIATVNDIAPITSALRDRMEIIEIPGYSPFDKVKIAQKHLVNKQRKENGLKDHSVSISDNSITKIIEEYTNEAGVRSLERHCGTVMRKVAVMVASEQKPPTTVKVDMVHKLLGPPKIFTSRAEKNPAVGVSAGLAWSATGGSLLFVEASLIPGKGEIELTGNLGKVIQESAKAAHTWIKANAEELGVDIGKTKDHNVHIHFPAGATPKDGPSAGVAVASAMLSLFLDKPVRNDVAMTGEITLRGRVLPIGGLREKVLAAHRAGIKEVIYPAQNEHDLEEVPKDVINKLELKPVSTLSEALKILIIDNSSEEPSSGFPTSKNEPLINMGLG